MTRISLVELAHKAIASHLQHGGIAIDATAGNGHDTLFLTQQVGDLGHVYSFDIQVTAINNTAIKLQQAGMSDRVELIQTGHQHWLDFVPKHHLGNISAIMFNLGYLPGGDKAITTLMETTLQALKQAPLLLNPEHGCMTVLAYPGHEQGSVELDAIENWCQQLDSKYFSIEKIMRENTRLLVPQLFIIKALNN